MRPKTKLWTKRLLAVSLAGVCLAPIAARRAKMVKPAKVKSLEFTPSVDEQVVVPGDTMWSMCEKITGKPWVWPRVWAMNPGVTNPHWLYPGDVIRFNPNVPIKARQATLIASDVDIPQGSEKDADKQSQGPRVEVVTTAPPPRVDKTRLTTRIASTMFVTTEELEAAGRLTNALPDHVLLGVNDQVFVTFPKSTALKVGDKYLVCRTRAVVDHPVTHRKFGYMSEVTGIATVEDVEKDVGRARLTGVAREVERGNFLIPFTTDTLVSVTPKTGGKPVAAVILAVEDDTADAGEQRRVFIDAGTNAGLERGSRLTVRSHGDPVTETDDNFPDIDLAQLMVIDAKDTASTCLIIESTQEVWPGDNVVITPQK